MRSRWWFAAGVLALASSARGASGGAAPSVPAVATEATPASGTTAAIASTSAFVLLEGQEVARQPPLRDLAWHVLGYTEDGTRLLAIDADGPALLDERGQVRARLACPQAEGSAPVDLSAAPNLSAVAVRYADGRVCAWDGAGQTLLGAPGKGTSAAAARGEDLVVLGYADGRLEGRNPRTGGKRWARNPELGPIVHLRMEGKGPRVAASTGSLGVSVLDTGSGRLVRALRGTPAYSAAFDPTGAFLAVGRANGRVELWDTKYWMARRVVQLAAGNVVDVDYSPDGTQLAVAIEKGAGAERVVALEVYDLGTDELVLRDVAPAGPGPTRLRYDATGDRLVVGNGPGASRMWTRPGARAIPRPPPNDEPPHQRPRADPPVLPPLPVVAPDRVLAGLVAVSPTGARALVREPSGLSLVDLATGAPVPLSGSVGAAAPFVVSPDGGRVAAWSEERLLVWDGATGALVGRVAVPRAHAVALLGERLAVATQSGKAYAGTLERMRAIPDAANVTAIALDPFHADRVAAGTRDGGVRVLDARGAPLGAWGVHAGAVAALAFSPDGRLLATAAPRPGADPARPTPGARLVVLGTDPAADAAAEPWSAVLDALPSRLAFDAAGERVLATSPTTLAVSTRGGLVLDASANVADAGFVAGAPAGTVRWADATGAVRTVVTAGPLPAVPRGQVLARSDDGRFAVTVDIDHLSVWDDKTGLLLRDLPATGQPVRRAVFDDAGDRLAVLYADASVEVYEVASGEALRNLPGPPAGADPWMRFSEDGALLWAFVGPRSVVAWEVATGVERARVEIPGEGALALDAATARGRFVRFVDPAKQDAWLDTFATSPKRLTVPSDGFRPVAVAPSGKWLAAVQEAALVRLDADSGRRIGPLLAHAGDTPGVAAAVSPDNAWIAVAYTSGLVRVWQVETGKVAGALGADARLLNRGAAKPLASLAFDAAGEIVTGRDATGFPRLWEWRLAMEAPTVGIGAGPVVPSAEITALAVSPDGKTLYSAHRDGSARGWDLATGAQVRFFWGHAGPITTLAVAAGGARLVTGAEDGTVRAWEATSGIEKLALNTFGDPVRLLAVSPDGWRVAAVGDAGVVRTWDAARGKALRRWSTPLELLRLTLPEPGRVEVTTREGVAWALDPGTGAAISSDSLGPRPAEPASDPRVLAVRADATALSPITAEVVTPDGRAWITAGEDGRIRLWDLDTRALRATLRAMTDGSWIVDRADGTRYASESLRDGSSPLLYRPPPK